MKTRINLNLAIKVSTVMFGIFLVVLIGLNVFIPTMTITSDKQLLIIKISLALFGGLTGISGFLLMGFTIANHKELKKIQTNMEEINNEK